MARLERTLVRNVEGVDLLGELVTWSCGGVKVTYADVVRALKDADLDHNVARRLLPRNAFKRACKALSGNRVIREIKELSSSVELVFQFTREKLENKEFVYETEDLVRIHRETGAITCGSEELRQLAQSLLDSAVESRTGSDVTRIIQRLFEQHAEMYPVRDRGGIYFCPIAFKEFVDKIASFMAAMNGTLDRWPVPAGLASSKKSVKESLDAGIARAIEDHLAAIEKFDEGTRDGTFERHEQAIATTAFKIEAYQSLLEEKVETLRSAVDRASNLLRAKMAGDVFASVGPAVSAEVVEGDDWIHAVNPAEDWLTEDELADCAYSGETQGDSADVDGAELVAYINANGDDHSPATGLAQTGATPGGTPDALDWLDD